MGRFSLLLRILVALLPVVSALKFDLQAHTGHSSRYERCIRNFVAKDTLVLVTAIVGGSKGDGQMVNMHVRWGVYLYHSSTPFHNLTHGAAIQISDAVGNEYGKPKDLAGETRMAFTSHADSAFDVCFENQLVAQRKRLFFFPPPFHTNLNQLTSLLTPNARPGHEPHAAYRTRHRHRRRRTGLVCDPSAGEIKAGRNGAAPHRRARGRDRERDGLSQVSGAETQGYE